MQIGDPGLQQKLYCLGKEQVMIQQNDPDGHRWLASVVEAL
jgi:hypothetical protein